MPSSYSKKKKSTGNGHHKKACYKSNITYAHLYRCSISMKEDLPYFIDTRS